jgi:hypothetical protein
MCEAFYLYGLRHCIFIVNDVYLCGLCFNIRNDSYFCDLCFDNGMWLEVNDNGM